MSPDVERWYLWHAITTRGESIRAHPVEPGALIPTHRALYRELCDELRAGREVDFDRLVAHHEGVIVDVYSQCNPLEMEPPPVATLAHELRDEYQRRKIEARLLSELEAVRAGISLDGEEAA